VLTDKGGNNLLIGGGGAAAGNVKTTWKCSTGSSRSRRFSSHWARLTP
jgi:hypothetical protein